MKQFNLEEYLKNPSKKVITRGGKNVRIICTDRRDEQYPIVALIEWSTGNEEVVVLFQKDGRYNLLSENNINDLFFASEKHEGWINIYCDTIISRIYPSEEEAKENACDSAIATIKIEWEE